MNWAIHPAQRRENSANQGRIRAWRGCSVAQVCVVVADRHLNDVFVM